MRKLNITLMAAVGWLVLSATARAQDTPAPETELETLEAQTGTVILIETNAPKTKLEAFEAQTGTVIIKGIAQIGTVFAQTGTATVRCKESRDAGTGRKLYGIAIVLQENNRPGDTTIIDYDELDSFRDGIDYIIKASRTVTALPSFSVVYTTRGGFRVSAYSSNNRPGTIQAVLQSSHVVRTRVLLAPDQLAKFRALIQQAKSDLDALRAK
jgi:hypothetical protein